VHADDALGSRRRRRDLRHRQSRRVRREDRIRADDPLELGEELELRAEVLDDRLDDEVAVGEIGQVGRQRKLAERRVALRRSHLLLVDLPLQEVRDPVVSFRPEFVRDLAAYGLVTRLDRQLRDPGTHCAEAHDTDPSDLRSGHEGRS